MSENSPNLALPFLLASQAQKHVTLNEALRILDAAVQAVVIDARAAPPGSPDPGDRHIVATSATGVWEGWEGSIAIFDDNVWRRIIPQEGWLAFDLDTSRFLVFDGSAWQIGPLGAPQLASGVLEALGIATAADATNRLAVAAPAVLLTHAGAGHQLKINKAAAGDTGSVLFQTGFSGRAEMGLAGEDDFSFKVSADGAAWSTGARIAAADGLVTLPAGLTVEGALTLPAGSVARAALTDGAARSVIGRSANSTGPVADITAGTDHTVLRRSGASLGFGALNLAQAAATTGQLPVNRGGTGAETAEAARGNLGLTLTETPTDATAGRVTKVADFGVGATSSPANLAIADIGSSPAGFYGLQASGGGDPDNPVGAGGAFLAVRGIAERMFGLFSPVMGQAASPRLLFYGKRPSEARTHIAELYHTRNLLGAVAQSGGVPTGAVIERGSNANGSYVRWADGTQMCWQIFDLSSRTSHGAGTRADPYRSTTANWTFPAAFSSTPALAALGQVNSASATVRANSISSRVVSNTAVQILQLVSLTEDADDLDVQATATAIGRWF